MGAAAAAGEFLRHAAGGYTGLHAATDVSGGFCIAAVPAGTTSRAPSGPAGQIGVVYLQP